MSRKDYQLLARVLMKNKESMQEQAYESLIADFNYALWEDNSDFNSKLFYKACGLEVK